jgi:hypothetical protein
LFQPVYPVHLQYLQYNMYTHSSLVDPEGRGYPVRVHRVGIDAARPQEDPVVAFFFRLEFFEYREDFQTI